MTTTATITNINHEAPDGVYDTIALTDESGQELSVITVPSSDDPEAYDAAVRAAGFTDFAWAEQSL